MQHNPPVSIITVTLNAEKYLVETIDSVLAQSYFDLEYIIVDGGSTDATLEIAARYQPLFTPRFKQGMRIVEEPGSSIYEAMNRGIAAAKGEIIGIINSDDCYAGDIVGDVARRMTGYAMLHGKMRFIDSDGRLLKTYTHKKGRLRRYLSTPFNHPTMFVRRAAYERLGLYNPRYSTAADYDFMLRFDQSALEDVYYNRVLAVMRTVGVTSAAREAVNLHEVEAILRERGLPAPLARLCARYRRLRVALKEGADRSPALITLYRRLSPYHAAEEPLEAKEQGEPGELENRENR